MHPNDAAPGRRLLDAYYDAVDAGDYDRLRSVLAPEFVHDRPDRTLSGREAFVSFMREDRPETDTRHEVTAAYRGVDGEGRPAGSRDDGRSGDGWVARGRLVGGDGGVRFEFVDVFAVGRVGSGADGSHVDGSSADEHHTDGSHADGRVVSETSDEAPGTGDAVRRIDTFVRSDP